MKIESPGSDPIFAQRAALTLVRLPRDRFKAEKAIVYSFCINRSHADAKSVCKRVMHRRQFRHARLNDLDVIWLKKKNMVNDQICLSLRIERVASNVSLVTIHLWTECDRPPGSLMQQWMHLQLLQIRTDLESAC